VHNEELTASALPANEGDGLDVTPPKTTKEMDMKDAQVPSVDSTGLSMLQKLTLFSVVVGLVLIYLKTRNSKVLPEKSMA